MLISVSTSLSRSPPSMFTSSDPSILPYYWKDITWHTVMFISRLRSISLLMTVDRLMILWIDDSKQRVVIKYFQSNRPLRFITILITVRRLTAGHNRLDTKPTIPSIRWRYKSWSPRPAGILIPPTYYIHPLLEQINWSRLQANVLFVWCHYLYCSFFCQLLATNFWMRNVWETPSVYLNEPLRIISNSMLYLNFQFYLYQLHNFYFLLLNNDV